MKKSLFYLTAVASLATLFSMMTAFAQQPAATGVPGQGMRAQMATQANPLARLTRALERAGAPALSSAEETQLNTMITNFRDANKPQAPGSALQTARLNLENAIVSGDSAGATTQVGIIVTEQNAAMAARMKAHASFAIDVVNVLKTNGQLDLLVKQFGNSGVARLAMSLAGGPGFGQGFGGGQRAMMMRRQPR